MLKRLIDLAGLKETYKRFPVSVGFALIGFILAVNQINDIISINDKWMARSILFCIIGFFWSCSVQIMQEANRFVKSNLLILLLSGLFIYGLFTFLPDKENKDILLMLGHLVAVNFILLSVAPYVSKMKGDENVSLWEYNRQFWFGAALAFLASIIFWLGFAGVLASVGYLFEFEIDSELYITLWAFSAMILAPVYALSNIPRQFTFAWQDCELQKALTVIIKWILLPLVFIYFAVLYTYFLKMLLLWEIPKGQLAYMILGFSLAGIITYLIAWPYKTDSQRFFLLFKNWFFRLLFLPALILALAVYLRIDQYGFTESRFYLCLTTLYLIVISIFMGFVRPNLKILFALPIILILVTSTPFFNALNVSQHSQQLRLDDVLMRNNLVVQGKIIPAQSPDTVSVSDKLEVTQLVLYLANSYQDDERSEKLYGIHDEFLDNKDFFDIFGFEFTNEYELGQIERQRLNNEFWYGVDSNISPIEVTGFDYFIPNLRAEKNQSREKTKTKINDSVELTLGLDSNLLQITIAEENLQIDPLSAVHSLLSNPKIGRKMPDPIEFYAENEKYLIKLHVTSINGKTKENQPSELSIINSISAHVLIKVK